MYSYYAIRAARIRVPKSAAMFVTVLQIAQMVVGVYIGITIYGIKSAGQPCQQTWENLYFSFLIYFSYFLLFCNFFYQTYLRRGNRYQKAVKKDIAEHIEEFVKKSNGVAKTNGTQRTPPLTRRRAQKID